MLKKNITRIKRHFRISNKITGTAERPRLLLRRTLKNLCAQAIDDITHKTLYSTSTQNKSVKETCSYGGNINAAKVLAKVCAAGLKEKGINKIAFDRGGSLYHGRIKAFADSLREEGIQF